MRDHPYASAAVVAVAALAASALVNRDLAAKAERDNPARGQFVEIDGVRLHYVERGNGEPLVLLHGNGSMIQDFESSGLLDMAAAKYRVIAFDRPGYGHTTVRATGFGRPRPKPTSSTRPSGNSARAQR